MRIIHAFYNPSGEPGTGRPEHTMTIVYRTDGGVDRCMVVDLKVLVETYGIRPETDEGTPIWHGQS